MTFPETPPTIGTVVIAPVDRSSVTKSLPVECPYMPSHWTDEPASNGGLDYTQLRSTDVAASATPTRPRPSAAAGGKRHDSPAVSAATEIEPQIAYEPSSAK